MITMKQARQQSPEVSKMVNTIIIGVLAAVVVVIHALVAIKWRGRFVPVNWHIFITWGLCALGIAIFYAARTVDIINGSPHLLDFIFWSRWLWGFVLVIIGLTAISALLIPVDKNNV